MESKTNKILKVILTLGTFYCINFSLSFAQQHKADSLYTVLKTESEDSNKVKNLNLLAETVERKGQYERTDSLAGLALQLAQKLDFKQGMASAYCNLGNYYNDKGNYHEALKNASQFRTLEESFHNPSGVAQADMIMGNVYEEKGEYAEAIKHDTMAMRVYIESDNKIGQGSINVSLGNVYVDEGNYPEALQSYLQSLKMDELTGNKIGEAMAYGNIGCVHYFQGNYTDALKEYTRSLEENEKLGKQNDVAIVYGDMGLIYSAQKNYAEAITNYLEALKIDDKLGNALSMCNDYGYLGVTFYAKGEYDEAIKYSALSLQLSKKIDNKPDVGSSYGNLGDIYSRLGKFQLAKQYLDSALHTSLSIGNKEGIKENYSTLAYVDSATKDYERAYKDYSNYVMYRDSLKNDENTKKLVTEQMQFDFDKKQAEEKAEQGKKDAVADADKHKQQIVTRSVSVGLLVVAVFAILLYSRFRVTQQQKKIIEEQKALVEEKNKDILDSITYAKRLQDAILPPVSIVEKYLPESFVLYKPKDIVAGDFYWLEVTPSQPSPLGKEKATTQVLPNGEDLGGAVILIAAADCTGHGVPGAMVSVVCSNALNRTVKEFKITEPGKILDKTRELVLETFEKSESNVQDGMDISLASITPIANGVRLQWAGAYNSLWYIENGEMRELQADKQPIGKIDKPVPFNTHSLNLQKGNTLYLFTDGYADQFGGPKGKKFKYKQLQEKLSVVSSQPMAEQKKILEQTLESWKGDLEQVDDILIIGIRV